MDKRPSKCPILIISGASGFIGKYLIEALQENYYIYAFARRSQRSAGLAIHKNTQWLRLDLSNIRDTKKAIKNILDAGGADYVFHLAGYYDFEYKDKPQYYKSNVVGTKNILESCKLLEIKRFIYSSSQAILDFSDPDRILDENSVGDADYPYARSKCKGEELVKEYSKYFPCSIVRLSAIFSDWCEYLPLYHLLTTWLSKRWDKHFIVGQGHTSIQYLHINDLIKLFQLIMEKSEKLPPIHTLNANPETNVSHNELFNIAYNFSYFHNIKAVHIPKIIARMGIIFRQIKGKIFRSIPFERLWMLLYIDKKLKVDASHTQKLLDWKPTKRYDISRRLLFLIDKMKNNPYEWHFRNKRRLFLSPRESEYLKIYETILEVKESIVKRINKEMMEDINSEKFVNYQRISEESRIHCIEYIFRMLEIDVRTGDRSRIIEFAQHLAEHRYLDDFPVQEVMNAMKLTTNEILLTLQSKRDLKNMRERINDEIAITLQMVMDEIVDTYQHLSQEN